MKNTYKTFLSKSKTDSVKTPEFIITMLKKTLKIKEFHDPCPFAPSFNKSTHTCGLTSKWLSPTFCNPPLFDR